MLLNHIVSRWQCKTQPKIEILKFDKTRKKLYVDILYIPVNTFNTSFNNRLEDYAGNSKN